MADRYPIRPIAEAEFDEFSLADQHAFHEGPPSAHRRARVLREFEFDRSLAAFDGAQPVATAGAYSFTLSVPGALVPAAGVTWVSVLPTHRRRGILSGLMRRQLTDIHERGEPLAVLWASESGIYGRFGYGRASWQAYFTIQRGDGALARHAPGDPALRLRITGPQDALAELAKVHEGVLPTQPGMFSRSESWWQRVLDDPEEDRQGASPLRCVLAEDDAGPRGYALYTGRRGWKDAAMIPDARLDVRELLAADPAAAAALWGDLLSRDLVAETTAGLRPADDPLLHLLADPRRARPQVSDGLWARLVDLPAALSQRQYASPVDVVIEVSDELCPWNAGRWRLSSAGPGCPAACTRTNQAPGLRLPVAALGAAYLGGTRLGALARAGLADEEQPGALAALAAAMAWDPAPWCPRIF
jgi:predicted acetyltransferase